MPMFNEVTPIEQNNYLILSHKSEYGLQKAAILLSARQAATGDANEVATITVELAKINAEIYQINADRQVVLAEMTSFNPPTAADLAKVTAISAALSQMVANSVLAQEIVAAATEIMNVWAGTK